MDQDLKIIKKKYGEAMMQLCRESFSTILDNSPGVLSQILLEKFAPSHFLYEDIANQYVLARVKRYIYCIYDNLCGISDEISEPVEDPVTLMKQAGYTLYVCKTEEEIQKFKKYYAKGEELCTFNGNRLLSCYVYFAVKEGAEELKRTDFSNPDRQDEYGTSVISIQFSRDDSYILSIKNRYNHTVSNPDATFSNNLDNIIPGLTQSFADHYGMKQNYTDNYLWIPDYVRANDGKLYKYNYEIDNVYYCPNNIVINNSEAIHYSKERYLVMDYFILDLVNKCFLPNIGKTYDSFPDTIKAIKSISIRNDNDQKVVKITPTTGTDIKIILDKYNRIISITDSNLIDVPNDYLHFNLYLTSINLLNAETIADNFLFRNHKIFSVQIPNVKKIGHGFMVNGDIREISLPYVSDIGNRFMYGNNCIKIIDFPKLQIIGDEFLDFNTSVNKMLLPSVTEIGTYFLRHHDVNFDEFELPNLKYAHGSSMMKVVAIEQNQMLKQANSKKVRKLTK